MPSKTAIVPVNSQYLPQNEGEREQVDRTVYIASIDKRVEKIDVKNFFESVCGPVAKLRLLGDSHHAHRIAFIEFKVSTDQSIPCCLSIYQHFMEFSILSEIFTQFLELPVTVKKHCL